MPSGNLILDKIQFGTHSTDANNFVFQTNNDGSMSLLRGSAGNLGTVLTIDAAGNITVNTPVSTDNTGKIATTAFVNSVVPGLGQTWQIVTGSRAFGTTYTNNTGRPIEVKVLATINGVSASNVSCTISGVAVPFGGWYSEGTFTNFVGHATIPPGATYNIASPGTLVSWAELR